MLILLPFLLSDDKLSNEELEREYYEDPDACDLSELMVIENVISGRKDIMTLFWENKLGVDVDVCSILRFIFLAMISTTYRTITESSYSRDQKA